MKEPFKTRTVQIKVSSSIGSVSAEVFTPPNLKMAMTLAHGAGANMHHSFMISLARSLAALDIATLRFNFPFTENKKGRPDQPVVAHASIAAAILKAGKLFKGMPLYAGGKSFGGRMTSQLLSQAKELSVEGIVFYGFPLHQPGKPGIERAAHLSSVRVPMLFLQGTKDSLATKVLISKVCKQLPDATLLFIEGADHSFKAGKTDTISMLASETAKWMNTVLAS